MGTLGCFLALKEWLIIEFLLPVDKCSDGCNRFCDVFSAEARRWTPQAQDCCSSCVFCPRTQVSVLPENCGTQVFSVWWCSWKEDSGTYSVAFFNNKNDVFLTDFFSFQKRVVWIISLNVFPGRMYVIPWNGPFLPFFTFWIIWLSSMYCPTSSQ